MVASPYEPCDNDRDEDCDRADYQLVTQAIGQCEDGNYNELADADHDGCVTEADLQQLFPTEPVNGNPGELISNTEEGSTT